MGHEDGSFQKTFSKSASSEFERNMWTVSAFMESFEATLIALLNLSVSETFRVCFYHPTAKNMI